MTTRVHVQLDISGALRCPSRWRDLFRNLDGTRPSTEDVRGFLLDESRKGKIAVALNCPAPNPDGTCPGHRVESESPPPGARGGDE